MSIKMKTLPLGALPYTTIGPATRMLAKLFEQMPYMPMLPSISPEDTILTRTLVGIPGVKFEEGSFILNPNTESYKSGLVKLDKAYNHADLKMLEPYAIDSVFTEKFFQLIKKFKPANACINLIGPFSISQILKKNFGEQLLKEKSFRKLFIQSVCVKALWAINKVKEISPETMPIIVLEEPFAGQFGNIKRESEEVTVELVTHMYERVVEKIKSQGALVAIQCMEKCDWKIPINAGVDIISFDAYNNPNNLSIIAENIVEFIERGGKINWGIVPVMTESMVKSLSIDYVEKRLKSTMEGLVLAGVPYDLVRKSAMVSVQGNVDHLPVIFAEKAVMLSTQLAGRISKK